MNAGQFQANVAGAGAFADDDVEGEIFHRRVKNLLDSASETMDLIDEQDVALAQIGENGGQIARPLDGWPRRHLQIHVHLVGDDVGDRWSCPAPAGHRAGHDPGSPHVAAPPNQDLQIVAHLILAMQLIQALDAQCGVEAIARLGLGRKCDRACRSVAANAAL